MDYTYAVVDKSKKIKNRSILAEENAKTNSQYAMVENSNFDSEPEYQLHSTSRIQPNAKPKPSRIVCYFVVLAIAVILLALVSLACIGALFVEINKLKSATTSHPEVLSPINNTLVQLVDQVSIINASVAQFKEVISEDIQEPLLLLMNFTEALKNETFSLLPRTEQLERSLSRVQGQFANYPSPSCAALPPSSLSGYYWVRDSNGSAVRVYCNMTLTCGGVTGGWMRVAELDITNSSHQCPSGLREKTDHFHIRTCVRNVSQPGCSAVQYSTSHIQYLRVCGKVIAYSTGSVDAFGYRQTEININSYVDGVSLTHGNPREHIWTFAAGQSKRTSSCKCNNSKAPDPPSFVGMDYFCDIVSKPKRLWDGVNCTTQNPCCTFNSPPWFYRELPQSTADAIEVRLCRDEDSRNEDVLIEMIEIYVQ